MYRPAADDLAFIQFSSGSTSEPKGVMLTHGNLIMNAAQIIEMSSSDNLIVRGQEVLLTALPLYHIFAFTVGMFLSMRTGGKLILIPNPRDLPAVLKTRRLGYDGRGQRVIRSAAELGSSFNALNGVPLILEINANPCITPDAGFAAAAAEAGLSYGEVIEALVTAA